MPPPPPLPLLSLSRSLALWSPHPTTRRLHTPRYSSFLLSPALSGNTCLTGITIQLRFIFCCLTICCYCLSTSRSHTHALAHSVSLALAQSDLLLLLTYLPFRCRFSSSASWNSRKSVSAANPETIALATGNVWWQFTRYLQRGSRRRRRSRSQAAPPWAAYRSVGVVRQVLLAYLTDGIYDCDYLISAC